MKQLYIKNRKPGAFIELQSVELSEIIGRRERFYVKAYKLWKFRGYLNE